MKQFTIIAIITLLFSAGSFAQSDIYVIDGKKVENYDGSQLVNRRIVSYKITAEKGKGRVHTITTKDAAESGQSNTKTVISSYTIDGNGNTKPLLIINGMDMTDRADQTDLESKNISRMTIYKAGSDSAKAYGEKGKGGVVKIVTKNSITKLPDFLVIVDGKEYCDGLVDIKSDNISSIEVFKGGSEAAKAYGEKGKNGVVKITLKK